MSVCLHCFRVGVRDNTRMNSSLPSRPVVVYDGAVTRADMDVWESGLEDVLTRIRRLFYRTESKKHAEQYFRVLLDRRLYLPAQSWMADPTRCAEARVPPEVTFRTRPAQVQEMIESARAAGVPFALFTADEEFGQNPGLCGYLEETGIPYVMA